MKETCEDDVDVDLEASHLTCWPALNRNEMKRSEVKGTGSQNQSCLNL